MKRRNEKSGEDPKRQKPDHEQDKIQIDEHGTNFPQEQAASPDTPPDEGDQADVQTEEQNKLQKDEEIDIGPIEVFAAIAEQNPDLMATYLLQAPEIQVLAQTIIAALTPADEL